MRALLPVSPYMSANSVAELLGTYVLSRLDKGSYRDSIHLFPTKNQQVKGNSLASQELVIPKEGRGT